MHGILGQGKERRLLRAGLIRISQGKAKPPGFAIDTSAGRFRAGIERTRESATMNCSSWHRRDPAGALRAPWRDQPQLDD